MADSLSNLTTKLTQEPVTDKNGKITRPWMKHYAALTQQVLAAIGSEQMDYPTVVEPKPDMIPLEPVPVEPAQIIQEQILQGELSELRAKLDDLARLVATQPTGLMMTITEVIESLYPVGSILLNVDGADPGMTFGVGTWAQVAKGYYLVGQLTGDPDFGTPAVTGGAKNHVHPVTTFDLQTSQPIEAEVDCAAGGLGTASSSHHHTAFGQTVNSANNSALTPFYVVYVWRRNA